MLIGAHVSSSGGLLPALDRGADIGADAVQVFVQSPRMWKPTQYAPEVLAAYRVAQAEHPSVRSTYCHASYLVNLATADRALLAKSQACLRSNVAVATAMGARGVVLHIGSHLGAGLDGVLAQVAGSLVAALDAVGDELDEPPCPVLLENAAGAGGTVGRSFEELASVIEAADGDERLGMCLDTQHLFASGMDFSTLPAADAVLDRLDATVGLARLGCLHLNDSKVALGANRDRHENLGKGCIGEAALGSLLSHPALDVLPALLEVPGPDGHGPGAGDLADARRILRNGRRRRSAAGRTRAG